MAINLLNISPHQVSRDMRGYIVFFYGEPKSGKTTTATKFPSHLLIAFQKGYNAIPGAMAQPVNSWSEFKMLLRQLKDEKVKEKFETIIVDTVDIAYSYCEKYICSNNSVDAIGDIPYGKGYSLVANEFDECLRQIVQLNYGLIMISHATDKTFTDEQGKQYNKIVPTLDKRANNIVARMADIIGYSRPITNEDGSTSTKLFIRGTNRFEAGSRFKYTPDYIDFTYKNLVEAIGDAIDKQAEEDGEEYFTSNRKNNYKDTISELNFDELIEDFELAIKSIPEDKMGYFAPRITEITDRYLGKGKKVANITRDQIEQLSLIVFDLKELLQEG